MLNFWKFWPQRAHFRISDEKVNKHVLQWFDEQDLLKLKTNEQAILLGLSTSNHFGQILAKKGHFLKFPKNKNETMLRAKN